MLRTDGRTDEWKNKQTNEGTDGRTGPTTRPAFAKATQVKIAFFFQGDGYAFGRIIVLTIYTSQI